MNRQSSIGSSGTDQTPSGPVSHLRETNRRTRRQQTEAQALLRSSEFAATRLADFTHQPPTKVDAKYLSARTRLTTAITDLGGKQAIQAAGAFGEETENQRVLRNELEDELRDINVTAAAIAEETSNAALMERFRMPHGQSDNGLAASARAIATAIRELELNDEFEAHGHPADTATDLEEMVDDFDQSEGEQGAALANLALAPLPAGHTFTPEQVAVLLESIKGVPVLLTLHSARPRPASS